MKMKVKAGAFTKEIFDNFLSAQDVDWEPCPMILLSPRHEQHEPYVRLLSNQWESGYIKPENCPLKNRCLDFKSLPTKERKRKV